MELQKSKASYEHALWDSGLGGKTHIPKSTRVLQRYLKKTPEGGSKQRNAERQRELMKSKCPPRRLCIWCPNTFRPKSKFNLKCGLCSKRENPPRIKHQEKLETKLRHKKARNEK